MSRADLDAYLPGRIGTQILSTEQSNGQNQSEWIGGLDRARAEAPFFLGDFYDEPDER
jgi:hypothetical protein